jgi:hypothetical protein
VHLLVLIISELVNKKDIKTRIAPQNTGNILTVSSYQRLKSSCVQWSSMSRESVAGVATRHRPNGLGIESHFE